MSTTVIGGVSSPREQGFSWGTETRFEGLEKTVRYVAYQMPSFPTWFGGEIDRPLNQNRKGEYVWSFTNIRGAVRSLRDRDVRAITDTEFARLRHGECRFWRAYDDQLARFLAMGPNCPFDRVERSYRASVHAHELIKKTGKPKKKPPLPRRPGEPLRPSVKKKTEPRVTEDEASSAGTAGSGGDETLETGSVATSVSRVGKEGAPDPVPVKVLGGALSPNNTGPAPPPAGLATVGFGGIADAAAPVTAPISTEVPGNLSAPPITSNYRYTVYTPMVPPLAPSQAMFYGFDIGVPRVAGGIGQFTVPLNQFYQPVEAWYAQPSSAVPPAAGAGPAALVSPNTTGQAHADYSPYPTTEASTTAYAYYPAEPINATNTGQSQLSNRFMTPAATGPSPTPLIPSGTPAPISPVSTGRSHAPRQSFGTAVGAIPMPVPPNPGPSPASPPTHGQNAVSPPIGGTAPLPISPTSTGQSALGQRYGFAQTLAFSPPQGPATQLYSAYPPAAGSNLPATLSTYEDPNSAITPGLIYMGSSPTPSLTALGLLYPATDEISHSTSPGLGYISPGSPGYNTTADSDYSYPAPRPHFATAPDFPNLLLAHTPQRTASPLSPTGTGQSGQSLHPAAHSGASTPNFPSPSGSNFALPGPASLPGTPASTSFFPVSPALVNPPGTPPVPNVNMAPNLPGTPPMPGAPCSPPLGVVSPTGDGRRFARLTESLEVHTGSPTGANFHFPLVTNQYGSPPTLNLAPLSPVTTGNSAFSSLSNIGKPLPPTPAVQPLSPSALSHRSPPLLPRAAGPGHLRSSSAGAVKPSHSPNRPKTKGERERERVASVSGVYRTQEGSEIKAARPAGSNAAQAGPSSRPPPVPHPSARFGSLGSLLPGSGDDYDSPPKYSEI